MFLHLILTLLLVAEVRCIDDETYDLQNEDELSSERTSSDSSFTFCGFRDITRFQSEVWTEHCSRCTCLETMVHCQTKRCPPFCRHRHRLDGDVCCAGCEIKESDILDNQLNCPTSEWTSPSRQDGETWTLDSCTSCVCKNGTTICMSETCCTQCPSITFEEGSYQLN